MKSPSAEDVARMAKLARIRVGEAEVARLTADVDRVVDYLELLFAVDVDGVEPLRQPGAGAGAWRADEPQPVLGPRAIAGSAGVVDGLVRVPKVMG